MKVDPRSCKCEVKEHLGWALLHDIVMHPLLGLTFYKVDAVVRLHDFTSHKAWPRPPSRTQLMIEESMVDEPVEPEQMFYALNRQIIWLDKQCDRLSRDMDYDCMFFEADRDSLINARVALAKALPHVKWEWEK